MKNTVIIIGALIILLFVAVSVCVQIFRAWRNTNKKLNEANSEIAALKRRIENQKIISEVMGDEHRKAERDKRNLHAGDSTYKFNAANDILRECKN